MLLIIIKDIIPSLLHNLRQIVTCTIYKNCPKPSICTPGTCAAVLGSRYWHLVCGRPPRALSEWSGRVNLSFRQLNPRYKVVYQDRKWQREGQRKGVNMVSREKAWTTDQGGRVKDRFIKMINSHQDRKDAYSLHTPMWNWQKHKMFFLAFWSKAQNSWQGHCKW